MAYGYGFSGSDLPEYALPGMIYRNVREWMAPGSELPGCHTGENATAPDKPPPSESQTGGSGRGCQRRYRCGFRGLRRPHPLRCKRFR